MDLDSDSKSGSDERRKRRSNNGLGSSSSSSSSSDPDSDSDSNSDSELNEHRNRRTRKRNRSSSPHSTDSDSDSDSSSPNVSSRTRNNLTWEEAYNLVMFVKRSKVGRHVNWQAVKEQFLAKHNTLSAANIELSFLHRKFVSFRKEWIESKEKPPRWPHHPMGASVAALNRMGIPKNHRRKTWKDLRKFRDSHWKKLGELFDAIGNEFALDGSERRRTPSQVRSVDASMRTERASNRSSSIRSMTEHLSQQTSTMAQLEVSSRVTDIMSLTNAQQFSSRSLHQLGEMVILVERLPFRYQAAFEAEIALQQDGLMLSSGLIHKELQRTKELLKRSEAMAQQTRDQKKGTSDSD